jgi:hypothetical protein
MTRTRPRYDPDTPTPNTRLCKNGEAMTTDPTKDQLADELAKVAFEGVGRPLKRGLTESDIDGLAAIARELAPDPTLPLHRLIAQAVIPAVKRLYPSSQQLAAAAVLWIELDRELGADDPVLRVRVRKEISKRNEEAAALLGRKLSYFEKRIRKHLLEHVGEQLLTLLEIGRSDSPSSGGAWSQPFSDGTTANKLDLTARGQLVAVAESSADLYCAGLVPAFVQEFLSRFDPANRRRYVGRDAWDGFGGYLFDAYAGFYVDSAILAGLSSDSDSDLAQHADEASLVHLRGLLQLAESYDPFDNSTESNHDPVVLREYGPPQDWPSLHYRLLYWYHTMRRLSGGRARFRLINEMYENVWMPWYRKQLSLDPWPWWSVSQDKSQSDQLAQMTALSDIGYDAFVTISNQIKFPDAHPLAVSRARASKMIAYYCDINDSAPILAGRSLQQRITYFFEQQGQLAESRQVVV